MTSSRPQPGRVTLAGTVAAMGVALALAAAPAGAAEPDTFSGVCDISGKAVGSPAETLEESRSTFVGEGTCNGNLNGEQVSDAPVNARASSSGFGLVTDPLALPLLFTGTGSATLVGEGATIGFTFQQIGPGVLLLQGNDGGIGVGEGQPLTETQPEQGNSTNVRIVIAAINVSG